MKKYRKLLFIIIVLVIIYSIYSYFSFNKSKLNYVALGDGLAEGIDSYGAKNYGYSDYIVDHFKEDNRLSSYTKAFAGKGIVVETLKDYIDNNKTVNENGTNINIRRALRESTLVTISIGANDYIKGSSIIKLVDKLENVPESKKEIEKIAKEVEELIILIKQYAKNQIILVGYYNPLPAFTAIQSQSNELITYSNKLYKEIAKRQKIDYVDIFDIFNNDCSYLPNPNGIRPNSKGYKAISQLIINEINH